MDQLNGTSPDRFVVAGVAASIYAALFLVEAFGLWAGKRWAEYLTTIATASLIPFEIYELVARDVGEDLGTYRQSIDHPLSHCAVAATECAAAARGRLTSGLARFQTRVEQKVCTRHDAKVCGRRYRAGTRCRFGNQRNVIRLRMECRSVSEVRLPCCKRSRANQYSVAAVRA